MDFFPCSLGSCVASHSVGSADKGRNNHAHIDGEETEVPFSMRYQKINSCF